MSKNVSSEQMIANLLNAQMSTGPKTDETKRKVSLNSLRHGFAGQTVFVPAHEKEAYTSHFQSFRAEYKPKGPTEQFLVQSMAELSWSAQQIRALTSNIMALLGTKPHPFETGSQDTNFNLAQAANCDDHLQKLNLLGIYEQRKNRLFAAARKELAEVQAARKLAEKEELEEAAHCRKISPPTWQPAEDGFACSVEEVDRYMKRAERLKRASGGPNAF